MANFQVVTRERHGEKRWHKFNNYEFTRRDSLVPLIAKEAPIAMMFMATGFSTQGDSYALVGVLSLVKEQNLFLRSDGKWAADYVPAVYRGHPFRLGAAPNSDLVLCVDEQSGLVDTDDNAIPFFGDAGEPHEEVSKYLQFLGELERDKKHTAKICCQLQELGLIENWPITRASISGPVSVGGLNRINEGRLNVLDGNALQQLRDSGALLLAYSQLFSMQNLKLLDKLAVLYGPTTQQNESSPPPDSGSIRFDENGLISFANLK